jgi:hypothetical protein
MSIYDESVIGPSEEQFINILKYGFKSNYDTSYSWTSTIRGTRSTIRILASSFRSSSIHNSVFLGLGGLAGIGGRVYTIEQVFLKSSLG